MVNQRKDRLLTSPAWGPRPPGHPNQPSKNTKRWLAQSRDHQRPLRNDCLNSPKAPPNREGLARFLRHQEANRWYPSLVKKEIGVFPFPGPYSSRSGTKNQDEASRASKRLLMFRPRAPAPQRGSSFGPQRFAHPSRARRVRTGTTRKGTLTRTCPCYGSNVQ